MRPHDCFIRDLQPHRCVGHGAPEYLSSRFSHPVLLEMAGNNASGIRVEDNRATGFLEKPH